MIKKITCIICPKGCEISLNTETNETTGNACVRGKNYAVGEFVAPVRTVTSALEVSNRKDTFVSVKTSLPVPKDKIFEVMKLIHEKKTVAPIKINDIIIKDIFGADIIATKNIE